MNEASKIREDILHYLTAKTVLDLGCGNEKVVSWATGVDSGRGWGPGAIQPDIVAEIDPAHPDASRHTALGERFFDVVFSSHALEHMTAPIRRVIAYWLSLVEVGGHLILYVPDERYYLYDPSAPLFRNPDHHHLLTAEVMHWHVLHLAHTGVLVIEKFQERNRDTGFKDEYSLLFVLRRTR